MENLKENYDRHDSMYVEDPNENKTVLRADDDERKENEAARANATNLNTESPDAESAGADQLGGGIETPVPAAQEQEAVELPDGEDPDDDLEDDEIPESEDIDDDLDDAIDLDDEDDDVALDDEVLTDEDVADDDESDDDYLK